MPAALWSLSVRLVINVSQIRVERRSGLRHQVDVADQINTRTQSGRPSVAMLRHASLSSDVCLQSPCCCCCCW